MFFVPILIAWGFVTAANASPQWYQKPEWVLVWVTTVYVLATIAYAIRYLARPSQAEDWALASPRERPRRILVSIA